jgi:hypothetical protein
MPGDRAIPSDQISSHVKRDFLVRRLKHSRPPFFLDRSKKMKSDHQPTVRPHTIEFIGGPFDGYREIVSELPDKLPDEVVWFVCDNVYRLLEGRACV